MLGQTRGLPSRSSRAKDGGRDRDRTCDPLDVNETIETQTIELIGFSENVCCCSSHFVHGVSLPCVAVNAFRSYGRPGAGLF
jgi:hypothetical protein